MIAPPSGPRIWVTRTQPRARATAVCLQGLGFTPVVAPVLETRALVVDGLDLAGVEALAFTSAAAVAAFAALTPRRDWPVFAVGGTTAARARAAGFLNSRSADGDVAALAALIADAEPRPALVLNPTAREPAADLAALLARSGVEARAVGVYHTVASDLGAPPADIDAVLIHSAKAAARVAGMIDAVSAARMSVFALSVAAARPLADSDFRRIVIAPSATETALLNLLQDPSMTQAPRA